MILTLLELDFALLKVILALSESDFALLKTNIGTLGI
jgi:hypothetical protein